MKTIERIDILDLMKQTESMLEGHYELSSGLHSNKYFQCAKLLQYPKLAQEVGSEIAEQFCSVQIDVVIGPALGGIIIAYEVARALNKKAIFAERKDRVLTLRRGFEINPDERALIIEDAITTAKSAKETAELVERFGGVVAGFGCIVDRSEGKSGINIRSLLQIKPEVYLPEECPLCKNGEFCEKPGSRNI